MSKKVLNESTRDCTIHMGKAIHRIFVKEKNPKTIRKIKYLIERKTIDFDSNSLQTEKANAFPFREFSFSAVFSIIQIFNGHFKPFLVLIVWVTVRMKVFAGLILDWELLFLYIYFILIGAQFEFYLILNIDWKWFKFF